MVCIGWGFFMYSETAFCDRIIVVKIGINLGERYAETEEKRKRAKP